MGSIGNSVTHTLNALKKSYRVILCFAVLLVVALAGLNGIVNQFSYWKYGMFEYEVKDFTKHKSSFEMLAKTAYRCFEEEYEANNQLQYIRFIDMGDEWWLSYGYSDMPESKKTMLDMTAIEKENVRNLYDALRNDYGGFEGLMVHADRVTFVTSSPYAVVWSRDGKKPEFIHSYEERAPIFSRKLSAFSWHWYQCVKK